MSASPHPLADGLPAMMRGDDDAFLERLLGALDEVLAPVFHTLDGLEAYVDPALAPADALAWLGRWMGLRGSQTWPEPRWRMLIAESAELYRLRGTPGTVRRIVELYTEGEVELVDPGGSAVVSRGDPPLVGPPPVPVVIVRVRGGRIAPDDPHALAGLEQIVRSVVPAHLGHRVEVLA